MASGASSRRTSLASLAESVEFPVERSEDDGEKMLNFHLFIYFYLKVPDCSFSSYTHLLPPERVIVSEMHKVQSLVSRFLSPSHL